MENQKCIVLSAPSGSGKTTLVKHLIGQPELALGFSISATSRAPRGQEKEGVDYYFLSQHDFRNKIEEHAFIEYEEVYKGTFYGTLKSEIQRIWSQNQNVVFDIDVVGGLNIKKQFPDKTLAIFIQPPNLTTLEKRLRLRQTDNEETIQKRLAKAKEELGFANQFDCTIVNDDLDQAKAEILQVVQQFLGLS